MAVSLSSCVYSNTSDAQKSVIQNKINYEKERLGFINEELKTYDPTKLKKDYNSIFIYF